MCCGPCGTYSHKRFSELGFSVHGYFFNPNIHPYTEFRRRLRTLQDFCTALEMPLTVNTAYDLDSFLKNALSDPGNRCRTCYSLRLNETAKAAVETGYPCFSSTLAVSPYQNHEKLIQAGNEAAQKHGVDFIYEDLRSGYGESVEISKKMALYRQPYCGCIFSEKERYCREGK